MVIDLKDNGGCTALHHACRLDHLDIVNLLIGFFNIDIPFILNLYYIIHMYSIRIYECLWCCEYY